MNIETGYAKHIILLSYSKESLELKRSDIKRGYVIISPVNFCDIGCGSNNHFQGASSGTWVTLTWHLVLRPNAP